MDDLLKDHKPARKFKEGTAFIFRLTAANYHRYCYVTDGKILLLRKIQGMQHCVRPIARRTVPVSVWSSREYQALPVRMGEFVARAEKEGG